MNESGTGVKETVSVGSSKSRQEDIDSQCSSRLGLAGFFETALRRFRLFSHILTLLPLYVLGAVIMGAAATPAVYLFVFAYQHTQNWPQILHFFVLATAVTTGYFIFGFLLILLLPLVNFLLPLRVRPGRGMYYSLESVPWYIHNALTYIARYAFLKFITPTPFNILFYRLMGMKIGRGVQLNTVNVSDPSLIELEDKVTIGGSVTLIGHYGSGGFLIIAPVRIGKGATIGLKATIMGDVEIGEGARVLPNSVVMPKTRIPAGEVWGGVPAQFISKSGASKK